MKSILRVKSIIFDFDGVIIESMGIKADAFVYIFREYPEIKDEILELHMSHGGMSRWEKIRIIYEEYLGRTLSNLKKQQLVEEFSHYVFERVIAAPYVKGALEYLEENYQKYLCFIVSGTPHEEINEIIRRRGLNRYFREILGSPDKKTELNQIVLKKYFLRPKEVISVGDALDDYEAAKEVGINFIGRILEGHNNFSNLPDVKYLINDLTELSAYVR